MAVDPKMWNQPLPQQLPAMGRVGYTPPTNTNPQLTPSSPAAPAAPAQKSIDQLTPDELAIQLGHYDVPYDPNSPGSNEAGQNKYLNQLPSDLLIKRYATPGIKLVSDQDRAGQLAYSQFKSTFGRDPSGSELSQILPSFMGPNGAIGGRQALANLQQTYKLNPSIDPNSKQNTATPQDFAKQIQDTFQQTVGRAPTANELNHFQDQFSKGALDSYGLEGVIKQSPEFTNAADTKFRSGLNDQLASYDATAFQKMAAPELFSKYAQNGMPAGSSPSLQYALTDMMGKMAQNRSQYMAQLSASQYGGNKDLATQNYQNNSNQMMNQWAGNLNQSQNSLNSLNQQGYNGMDYQTQMNDMMKYMSANRQRPNNFMNYLNTGINAIGTGAQIYGMATGNPRSYLNPGTVTGEGTQGYNQNLGQYSY